MPPSHAQSEVRNLRPLAANGADAVTNVGIDTFLAATSPLAGAPYAPSRFPFDADEIAAVYRKRFATEPPPEVVAAMAHWDLTNEQRAVTAYNLGLLTRIVIDHVESHPEILGALPRDRPPLEGPSKVDPSG